MALKLKSAALLLVTGCSSSAVMDEFERPATGTWGADTLVRAGSFPGTLVGPLRVIVLKDERLVVSDAASNQLVLVDISNGTLTPLGDRHYRPAAPLFLDLTSDGTIVAGRPRILEFVSVPAGTRRAISPPESPWGDSAIGSFSVRRRDSVIVMAPAAAGRFYPTLNRGAKTTSHSLVAFRPWGKPTYFGPGIPFHDRRYSASLEQWSVVAGWAGDSAVVVNLMTAEMCSYTIDDHLRAKRHSCRSLGRAFEPYPPVEINPPSPDVTLQPQLRDAVLLGNGTLAVLRYLTYRWATSIPWRRVPGNFIGVLALQLYTIDGGLLHSTPLRGSGWRGIAPVPGTGDLILYQTGDGSNPTIPVLLRYDERQRLPLVTGGIGSVRGVRRSHPTGRRTPALIGSLAVQEGL